MKRAWLELAMLLALAVFAPLAVRPALATGAYRCTITIANQVARDLSDYAVKIVLDSTWAGWNYSPAPDSIYFTDADGNPLYFWAESWDSAALSATIWVKVPLIPASGSTTIYMYFGGSNPYAGYNDPKRVFLVYDDFAELDTEYWGMLEWTGDPNHRIECSGGELHIFASSASDHAKSGYILYAQNVVYDWSYDVKVTVKARFASFDYSRGWGPAVGFQLYSQTDGDGIAAIFMVCIGAAGDHYVTAIRHTYDGSSSSNYYIDVSDVAAGDVVLDVTIKADGTVTWSVSGAFSVSDTFTQSYKASGYFAIATWMMYWTNPLSVDAYYDYIIIRKFVDPEPAVTVGAVERVLAGPALKIVWESSGTLADISGNLTAVVRLANGTERVFDIMDNPMVLPNESIAAIEVHSGEGWVRHAIHVGRGEWVCYAPDGAAYPYTITIEDYSGVFASDPGARIQILAVVSGKLTVIDEFNFTASATVWLVLGRSYTVKVLTSSEERLAGWLIADYDFTKEFIIGELEGVVWNELPSVPIRVNATYSNATLWLSADAEGYADRADVVVANATARISLSMDAPTWSLTITIANLSSVDVWFYAGSDLVAAWRWSPPGPTPPPPAQGCPFEPVLRLIGLPETIPAGALVTAFIVTFVILAATAVRAEVGCAAALFILAIAKLLSWAPIPTRTLAILAFLCALVFARKGGGEG